MHIGSFLVSEYQTFNDSVAGANGLFFSFEERQCREDESSDFADNI